MAHRIDPRTGVDPISHMLVVKNDQLAKNPWLAEELFTLFQTAKRLYIAALHAGAAASPADQAWLAMSRLVGDDPIPYGFEAARQTLETFVGFNVDQRVIPQWVDPKEVFAPTTIGLSSCSCCQFSWENLAHVH